MSDECGTTFLANAYGRKVLKLDMWRHNCAHGLVLETQSTKTCLASSNSSRHELRESVVLVARTSGFILASVPDRTSRTIYSFTIYSGSTQAEAKAKLEKALAKSPLSHIDPATANVGRRWQRTGDRLDHLPHLRCSNEDKHAKCALHDSTEHFSSHKPTSYCTHTAFPCLTWPWIRDRPKRRDFAREGHGLYNRGGRMHYQANADNECANNKYRSSRSYLFHGLY